ncbi:hypothetical protein BJX61DRAFT_134040 [Aspergillus egyptiacus]|nr:hypothetical protein BJX61DRAFT_134040 [Aspergillus egyptiacus]
MPRTLPWLTGAATSKTRDSPVSEIKRTSSPKVKVATPEKKQSFTSKRDFLRSSPSPPSSPIYRCPSEEFLREGLDADDIHIMVEDEFYAVAQTFTRHLHYAEYARRKNEAKDRNAATIADLARPTDGVTPMTEELKKKYAAEELKARQTDGLNKVLGKEPEHEHEIAGDDIEAENSWAGTHLQDLMLSPRRARSLVGLQGIRSSTRAAKGFAQADGSRGTRSRLENMADDNNEGVRGQQGKPAIVDETTTDEDDDDLDAGVNRSTAMARQTIEGMASDSLDPPAQSTRPAVGAQRAQASESGNRAATTKTERKSKFDDFDGPGRAQTTKLPNRVSTGTKAERRFNFDDFDGVKIPRATEAENENFIIQPKRRVAFDDFDELPELPNPAIQLSRRRSGSSDSKQMKYRDKDTRSKKSRLNEVPTFLI